MPFLLDRTGHRYGRLVVTGRDHSRPPATRGARVYWLCLCDCGNRASKTGHELASGDTTSCGCFKREAFGTRSRTHGQTRSPTYRSWQAAKQRCFDKSASNYSRYGGRGITMSQRWAEDFSAFLADVGERPSGMTLDRIDPNGHYEPGNVRWADSSQQLLNQRRVGVSWRGQKVTIGDLARQIGVPRTSLNKAIKRFPSLDAAVAYAQARIKR